MVFTTQIDHLRTGGKRAAGTNNLTFSIAFLRAASLRVPQGCSHVMVQGAAGTNIPSLKIEIRGCVVLGTRSVQQGETKSYTIKNDQI